MQREKKALCKVFASMRTYSLQAIVKTIARPLHPHAIPWTVTYQRPLAGSESE